MRNSHVFIIDSDSSGHRLSVDGDEIGKFRTLKAAEARAFELGRVFLPTTIRFALDFKWTLSDVELRAATLQC
jgi:hypothetical protein